MCPEDEYDEQPDDEYTALARANRISPWSDHQSSWQIDLEADPDYLAWQAEVDRRAARQEAEAANTIRSAWRADGQRLSRLVSEQADALDLDDDDIVQLWREKLRDLIHAPRWGMCVWCNRTDAAYKTGLCRACAAYRRKYGRLRTTTIINRHHDRAVEREMIGRSRRHL